MRTPCEMLADTPNDEHVNGRRSDVKDQSSRSTLWLVVVLIGRASLLLPFMVEIENPLSQDQSAYWDMGRRQYVVC
jgi:hypothetical protein